MLTVPHATASGFRQHTIPMRLKISTLLLLLLLLACIGYAATNFRSFANVAVVGVAFLLGIWLNESLSRWLEKHLTRWSDQHPDHPVGRWIKKNLA